MQVCSVMSTSFAIPWTVAHQAPLSMDFCRQEYWSGWPVPPPGDLPHWDRTYISCSFRQILYHLSHLGSPIPYVNIIKKQDYY